MSRFLPSPRVAATIAALCVVSGCTSSGSPETGSQDKPRVTASPTAERKAYDPPQAFESAGVPLPKSATAGKVTNGGVLVAPLPVALHQATAYIGAADHVTAVDTMTGQTLATIRPAQQAQETSAASPPEGFAPSLASSGGRTLVLAPFAVTIPGSGTQPSRSKVELVAVDTASNKTVWRLTVDLPNWADDSGPVTTAMAGAAGNTAVFSAEKGNDSSVFAIDVTKRAVQWQANHIAQPALVGGHVLALDVSDLVKRRLVGLALDGNGTTAWTRRDVYEARLISAGPDLAVLSGRDYGSGDESATLFKGDGSTAGAIHGDTFGLICSYDGQAITVCRTVMGVEPRVFAVRATNGDFLWQLPQKGSDRLVPTVSAAWHGTVYGKTSNGPLLLDAQSGADRSGDPGIAPSAVNEYVGLAIDDNDVLNAHPATR
jgi:hypothetical protein